MRTIVATCSECRESVTLPQRDVRVDIYPDPEACTFTFTCTECGQRSVKPATGEVRRLLDLAVEVEWVDHKPPAEALEPKAGPPIDLDYLIDFSLELEAAHPELMRILCEEEAR